MRAFGWISVALRKPLASWVRRGRSKIAPSRKNLSPGVESLEKIDLLSRAGLGFLAFRPSAPAAMIAPVNTGTVQAQSISKLATSQVSSAQTAVVPDTLTNFDLPFNPSIDLFDSALGELVSVKLNTTATLNSQIISQNTSTNSGADITGFTNGSYSINGLPTPISGVLNGTTATVSVPAFPGGNPDFTGPTTVTFPPLVVTDTEEVIYTSPADLAFFTQSVSQTSITPTLIAQAQSGAVAPNGNLQTDVRTFGSGQISVVYEYAPRCPTVVRLVRFGIHHQPTQLQLTFEGVVNPADAENVANYRIIVPNKRGQFSGPGVTYVPIVNAVFNPADNTVLLTSARQLNVHRQFQLEIEFPCNEGNAINIQFGGKASLGGFTGHRGEFIPFPIHARGSVIRRFR